MIRYGGDYTCAMCGGVFKSTITHEEAAEEYAAVFPTGAPIGSEHNAVVCEDCWNLLPCSKRENQPVLGRFRR